MSSPDHHRLGSGPSEFAAVLSEAIARRNLTLERISQHLRKAEAPVSIATLSYWQTGRSLPTRARSLKVLKELENVLKVPEGHLTRALAKDAGERWDPVTALPHNEQASALLKAMGFPAEQQFTNQLLHDSVTVRAREHRQNETTRQLLRADRPGLRRFPLLLSQDGESHEIPLVETIRGCELGEVMELEDPGLVVAEIVLPHPLERGELAMLEYQVAWTIDNGDRPGITRALAAQIPFLVLDVAFTDDLPTNLWYVNSKSPTPGAVMPDTTQDEHTTPLPTSSFAQQAMSNATAGMHGLRWEF
ncbi:hypothetical protein [Luteococcus sp. OSA5]|uniref:hypothetical protein n=1 Tax=Luteococcus sp. OSA5 TaxID=3401630 RepID=UPI003B4326ED